MRSMFGAAVQTMAEIEADALARVGIRTRQATRALMRARARDRLRGVARFHQQPVTREELDAAFDVRELPRLREEVRAARPRWRPRVDVSVARGIVSACEAEAPTGPEDGGITTGREFA